MKIPSSPPNTRLSSLPDDVTADDLLQALQSQSNPLVNGIYMHWDDLRYRPLPQGVANHELWWFAVRLARHTQLRVLPLLQDKGGVPMRFSLPEPVLRLLSFTDREAAGQINLPDQVVSDSDRDHHIVRSLMEEAITSSQLEGASTTRVVAEAMLREGRPPRDHGERMIFNNYAAMHWIRTHQDNALTPEHVLDLHRIVTENTLKNPEDAGRLRDKDDVRVVDHRDDTVLHVPPSAASLPDRLARLCAFANGTEEDEPFVPPVLRAILVHFMIGYDHPFMDGNGRTARALFYWCMTRQGYWLMEYLSISHIIKRAPAQYARAFLHCETDGNDTTYFVLHQLEVIREAIKALHDYLGRKSAEQRRTESMLRQSRHYRNRFNHRQIALLNHALKNPGFGYGIEGHQRSHTVAYATARSDLLGLADAGLLEQTKRGRALWFIAPDDLHQRIGQAEI